MDVPGFRRFYATVNPGLEDVAVREIGSIVGLRLIETYPGFISFEADESAIYLLNLGSRTIHKLILTLAEGRITELSDAYRVARDVSYLEYIGRDQSFAVRAERIGVHSFTSVDVAAQVGQAVIDSYRAETGVRLKVDLRNPDVEVFCRVREDRIWIGINTSGESLHKRGYRVYDHPAALKPTIAASMLMLAGWRPGDPILDPMCGGATIPIEAALISRGVPPGLYRRDHAFRRLIIFDMEGYEKSVESLLSRINKEVYPIRGLEIHPKHLRGGVLNAFSAGVLDTVDIRRGDARRLHRILREPPSHIVVNPPYGRRSLDVRRVRRLYYGFARSLKLLGGPLRLTAITAAPNIFKGALEKHGFTVIEDRVAKHGDLYTHIIVAALE